MFDLSIVIITHNNQRLLLDCLKSLYSSSPSLSLQVIVVFNRCGDESRPKVQQLFPKVQIIDNPHNEGFSRANNHGLKLATGEFVMLLNDDTLVSPNALKILVDFLKQNPKVGAVGPKLLNPDGSLQVAGSKLAGSIYKTKLPRRVKFVGFASVMFPKSVIQKVGLLDENYFFYNEELDYLKRVRKQGYECWYVPAAEIVHFGGQSTKTRRYDFELEGLKGGLYFVNKFYSWVYPLYRGVFAVLALGLQILAPLLLLSVQSKSELIARSTFYRNVFKLAWGFRIGQYVPRKYFD